jgi:hypothetical protein
VSRGNRAAAPAAIIEPGHTAAGVPVTNGPAARRCAGGRHFTGQCRHLRGWLYRSGLPRVALTAWNRLARAKAATRGG